MGKKAERRAHYFRLKEKRKNYYGYNPREHHLYPYRGKAPSKSDIEYILGFRVNTCPDCSCPMCGNPRRHFKKITRQEYISLLRYADGIEEVFGWRPYFNKYTQWW